MTKPTLSAVVPAAGIGRRMGDGPPKQYRHLGHQSILAHTLDALLHYQPIGEVIVALHPEDHDFADLVQAHHPKVRTCIGGNERADSVLAALSCVTGSWVMVHDAARPCVQVKDLDALWSLTEGNHGGLLGCPVRDTLKRVSENRVETTVDRSVLWHALTPQLFPTIALQQALAAALSQQLSITDEASAMEWAGHTVTMVRGCSSNIKVTQPEDMALAAFYLHQQNRIATL